MTSGKRCPGPVFFALVMMAVAGAALVAPQAAFAYVRTTTSAGRPMYWANRCISITAFTGSPPANLAAGQFLPLAQAAAMIWTANALSCTDLEIKFQTSAANDGDVAYDLHNSLMFRRPPAWCRTPRDPGEGCYDHSALAITSVFSKNDTGVILDADIEINAVDFQWADLVTAGAAASGAQDVPNALAHEFGHFIGIDHTCYGGGDRPRPADDKHQLIPDCSATAPTDIRATTMYAAVVRGDTSRRDLEPDDKNAACGVYPTLGTPACSASHMTTDPSLSDAVGGCSFGGDRASNRDAGLLCASLFAVVLFVRKRKQTL